MKRLFRVLGALSAVLAFGWLSTCAWLSLRNPVVSFAAEELARPPAPLPRGFRWGTATSAHQLEGGNRNDGTRFEGGTGHIEGGDTSAIAADGWNRMGEDITLMSALRANAYRFSIEWSRLEPDEGTWDEAAWARYGDFVKQLGAAGITPMVTLLHFTLPLWMADRGGVTAPDFPDRFARFAAEAGRRLGPDVDLWVTLNERISELVGTAAFFGLNYYFRYFVRIAPGTEQMVALEPGPGLRSELGGDPPSGDSPPEALFLLMREAWRRYRLPLYVTEGGIADEHGTMRGPLIRGQVEAIQRALAEGIPVKGYLHWSLVDNFEWDKGYRPRFGLYRLDRRTMARTPAGGADVFAALAPPPR